MVLLAESYRIRWDGCECCTRVEDVLHWTCRGGAVNSPDLTASQLRGGDWRGRFAVGCISVAAINIMWKSLYSVWKSFCQGQSRLMHVQKPAPWWGFVNPEISPGIQKISVDFGCWGNAN